MCKFSMKFASSFIIGKSGFFGKNETPKVNFFTVNFYTRYPFIYAFIPMNTNKSTGVVRSKSSIACILRISSLSQIFPSVVERVVVDVVGLFFWATPKNFSRHWYVVVAIVLICAYGIKAFCDRIPDGPPNPLFKPFVVLSIDDSDLILRQSNKAVRFIEWLDNRLPWQRRSGHDLSSTKVLFPATILA